MNNSSLILQIKSKIAAYVAYRTNCCLDMMKTI